MGQTVAFFVILASIVGIAVWTMLKPKSVGYWIVYTGREEELHVNRTASDARNDGRETMQFHLIYKIDKDGNKVDGGNRIIILPHHWILEMDKDDFEQ